MAGSIACLHCCAYMTPDSDDDRTVFDGPSRPVAPPADVSDVRLDKPLPVGTRLAEFEIVGVIGVGGFSFVYLAQDHSLGRRVALKEYMPQSLAWRGEAAFVSVRSERHAEAFEAGRRSFVNEAQLLAQFDHPSLVKVYRFWEANGTAYMAMPNCAGRTLKDRLKEMSQPPDEAWLKRLLAPMLSALETIHEDHIFHRDVAPDNIMLLSGDRPILLDFGAARHAIADMNQTLTVILKSGYAPIEQYDEVPDMKQGAWTDIYALAAVMYFSITGIRPFPALGRMLGDKQEPLARKFAGLYSREFLEAIDCALAVMPQDRPQSISELRERLGLHTPEAGIQRKESFSSLSTNAALQEPAVVASKGFRSRVWIAAGLAVAATVAIGVVVWRNARMNELPTPITSPPTLSASAATLETVLPPTPTPSTASAVSPFNPLSELDRIFEQRDRDQTVSVTLPRTQVTINQDRLRFNVSSARGGYLYVLMVGTDRRNFWLLFPNEVDADNRIPALGRLDLPRKDWELQVTGPPGTNLFIAVVSENRRDFSGAGLVKSDIFGEFPLDVAAGIARTATGPTSPFLGVPICVDTGSGCSAAYGATMFSIEEVAPTTTPRR